MIFAHTSMEPRLWRGWLRDGQTFEVSWGGCSVGLRLTYHAGDTVAQRFLWIGLGLVQVFVPLGLKAVEWDFGDEPQWGLDMSRELAIHWQWGQYSRRWEWPFHLYSISHDVLREDGSWRDVWQDRRLGGSGRSEALVEEHPYRYVLRSGEVQERTARVTRERFTSGRHILSRLGWPKRVRHSIWVEFSDEVGEGTGSWKGGTVGCGWTMLPGETAEGALRRMERERKFDR